MMACYTFGEGGVGKERERQREHLDTFGTYAQRNSNTLHMNHRSFG
jgi:hypothetical protein